MQERYSTVFREITEHYSGLYQRVLHQQETLFNSFLDTLSEINREKGLKIDDAIAVLINQEIIAGKLLQQGKDHSLTVRLLNYQQERHYKGVGLDGTPRFLWPFLCYLAKVELVWAEAEKIIPSFFGVDFEFDDTTLFSLYEKATKKADVKRRYDQNRIFDISKEEVAFLVQLEIESQKPDVFSTEEPRNIILHFKDEIQKKIKAKEISTSAQAEKLCLFYLIWHLKDAGITLGEDSPTSLSSQTLARIITCIAEKLTLHPVEKGNEVIEVKEPLSLGEIETVFHAIDPRIKCENIEEFGAQSASMMGTCFMEKATQETALLFAPLPDAFQQTLRNDSEAQRAALQLACHKVGAQETHAAMCAITEFELGLNKKKYAVVTEQTPKNNIAVYLLTKKKTAKAKGYHLELLENGFMRVPIEDDVKLLFINPALHHWVNAYKGEICDLPSYLVNHARERGFVTDNIVASVVSLTPGKVAAVFSGPKSEQLKKGFTQALQSEIDEASDKDRLKARCEATSNYLRHLKAEVAKNPEKKSQAEQDDVFDIEDIELPPHSEYFLKQKHTHVEAMNDNLKADGKSVLSQNLTFKSAFFKEVIGGTLKDIIETDRHPTARKFITAAFVASLIITGGLAFLLWGARRLAVGCWAWESHGKGYANEVAPENSPRYGKVF